MRRFWLLSVALAALPPAAEAGGPGVGGCGAGRPARPVPVASAPPAAARGAPDGPTAPESARVALPEPTLSEEAEAPTASVELGITTTNRYLYRGFLVEDEGAIVQAWIDVRVPLYVGSGFVRQVDLGALVWTSFGTGPTGTGGDTEAPRAFSEVDWTLSATAQLAGGWSVGASLVWFRYPNGSAEPVQEATLTCAFDDGPRWPAEGRFRGFSPTATLGVEGEGQSDGGLHPGTYLGVGMSPRLSLTADPEGASVALSVTAGFSLSDYYEDATGRDETFGYVELGPELALPLWGSGEASCSLTLGVHVLLAGDHVRRYNDADEPEIVAFLTFLTSF